MTGKIISFKKKLEEKKEADKVVNIEDYRNRKKTANMSKEEFQNKYMKNSIRSIYGDEADKVIQFLNKEEDELPPDEPA